MKKLLLVLFILIGYFSNAQSNYVYQPPRYRWIAGKFDSTLHAPGFASTPTLRTGGWSGAGALGVDTVNHRFYFYSGGSFRRVALYSELGGGSGTPGGSAANIQFNRASAFAGTDSLKYDSVLKVTPQIWVTDTIVGLNGKINGSVQVGDSLASNKVSIWFGNSVTAGYNLSSPTTQRFSYLTSHNFGWSELNRGISGTRMTHSGVSNDSCMIDRIPLIPTYSSTYSAIFFDYGLNDDQAGIDTTTFKTSYARVIDTCTARGWPVSKIFLLTPSYNWYSGTSHTANFKTAILTLAASKGVNGVDVYTYMRDHGGTALIQADSLHPNATGNEVTRQAISQFIKTAYKRVGDLVVTGDATLNGTVLIKSSSTLTSGISAIDDTNTGFAINSGNVDQAAIFNGGVPSLALTRNFMQGDASWQYCWTTGTSGGFAGGPDAGIAKNGAAALRISNGSTGYGSLAASALIAHGSTSGDVTIQSTTGTYNFNLPTSAGSDGQSLYSKGGGSTPMQWAYDTTALFTFGFGTGAAGDTDIVSSSAIYGSFFHSGSDTLIVTSIRVVMQGTNDTLGVNIEFNDSLNVTGTKLNTSYFASNNNYTGNNFTSFTSTNNKIPPGNHVWFSSPTVVAGRKPTYVSVTAIGYKKRI